MYEVLKVHTFIIPDSSMVEHTAVNRGVVGSSPTRGVSLKVNLFYRLIASSTDGPMVKRLRHRPFTAVTRVRFPLGSLSLIKKHVLFNASILLKEDADMAQLAEQLICNQQVEGSSPPIGLTT